MGTRRRLPPPLRKPRLRIEDHSKKHSVDLCGLRCAPFRVSSLILKADISGYLISKPFRDVGVVSALPPKADMCGALADVRYGPKADSCSAAKLNLYSINSSARC